MFPVQTPRKPRGPDRAHGVALWLLLAPFLTGCTDGGTEQDVAGSAGFETVANLESSPSEPFAWTLIKDLRVGAGPTGSAVEQFGRVRAIAADSRGRIFVMDGLAQHIRVFDASGEYLHTIGREGSGPGEFTGIKTMAVGRGDTLWVIDDGEMRYSLFGPDGDFITSYPRDIRGFLSSASGTVLPDGSFIDWAPHQPDGRSGPRFLYRPLRLAPPEFDPDSFPPILHTWRMVANGRLPVTRFGGEVAAAVDDSGGIWFAHTSEYLVYRRTLAGDTTLALSLDATAPEMGEAERDHIRETFGRNPDLASEYLAALPETKPVVERIVPDNAGHLLVAVDISDRQRGTIIDVFRDSGEYLGRMELPISAALPGLLSAPVIHATADHLYVIAADELDVQYLVRFRIERTTSPGP